MKKNEEGKYPPISEAEHLDRQTERDSRLKGDEFWKAELDRRYCLSTPKAWLVHFGHQVKSVVLAVPYHVVRRMAWEYPYQNGQARDYLPNRLAMASLYGVEVGRPGYLSAFHRPDTQVRGGGGPAPPRGGGGGGGGWGGG